MTHGVRIDNAVTIECTPEEVFAFGATADNWPKWHPTATSVSGPTHRPVEEGDRIVEQDRFAVMTGAIHWHVRHATPGKGWAIDGDVIGVPLAKGSTTSIEYFLTPTASGGTRVERTMTYRIPTFLGRIMDKLYLSGHNVKQSEAAVQGLKTLLEPK